MKINFYKFIKVLYKKELKKFKDNYIKFFNSKILKYDID